MRILSIDTSCDETSAALTENLKIISNVVWSQASLHAKFGGVMPSLAQRMHEERIDFTVNKALGKFNFQNDIDAIAVTAGPGLAIALGTGIKKAKVLAKNFYKPLIAVNHLEGHILSPLAIPATKNESAKLKEIVFPALGLVVSGGNTLLVEIEGIGKYKTLAATTDDALGEALDKAARMLGLGYPGGAILEELANEGNTKAYNLPIPIVGQEKRKIFTYSGLKTAMYRLVETVKEKNNGVISKKEISDLSASFQDVAFKHLLRVSSYIIKMEEKKYHDLLIGGGVIANIELRKRIRKLSNDFKLRVHFPYTQKLTGDNAAMIGIAAYFKASSNKFEKDIEKVDREANAKIDSPFKWK